MTAPQLTSARRVFVTVLMLVATAHLTGCGDDKAKQAGKGPAAAVPVTLAPARTGPVQRSVEVVGTLFGDEDATISNKVNGKVIVLYKDVGDRAEAGEPLGQLLRNDYLLDVNQKESALLEVLAKLGMKEPPAGDFNVEELPSVRRARLQAQNAEARFSRGKDLRAQRPPLISDQDFEDLQTVWETARTAYDAEVLAARGLLGEAKTKQADLRIAQQALSDTTIRAPQEKYAAPDFESAMRPTTGPSGDDASTTRPTTGPATAGRYVVAARYASVGELVRAVTPMFRLVDDDPLKLRAAVPERFFPEIRIGQKVQVRVEAYPEAFPGVVTRINPQVDVANRTFPIEVVVPNPKLVLPPGAFARASVQTRVQDGVVFVPLEAVVSFAGVDKVFTVQDGKAREVAVDLGDRRGNEVEIVKGLKGTEQVAVTGTSRLANGVPVEVRTATAVAKTQPAAARTE
jgi:multidrug efflux pump subunit AcrA (membrane-fusion protein)